MQQKIVTYLQPTNFRLKMSAVCAVAESKWAGGEITFNEADERHYYSQYTEGGLLKITGVAWLTKRGSKSSFCQENRIALTKEEQKAIGDSQPFLLPEITYDKSGEIINDRSLAIAYLNKMTSKGKGVTLSKEVGKCEYAVIDQIVADAKERAIRFRNRHFPMCVLREAIKGSEKPQDALIRGLKEECKKRFVDGASIPQFKFAYERRGNTCLLVYFVDADLLEDDIDAIKESGKCNYFCAKSVSLINNDYQETREHEMLEDSEIERRLVEFEKMAGEEGIGCDLKYWGGLKMWRECKKYF